MKLNDLLDLIASSDPDEWNLITSEPTYRGQTTMVSRGGADGLVNELNYDEHTYAAAYSPDLDITIAWGLDPNEASGRGDRDFSFANPFPDPSTSESLLDVFYRGALVHRERLVSVDGGRALLPACNERLAEGVSDDGKQVVEYWTTPLSRDLARFVHEFHRGANDFAMYVQRAGIIVE